MIAENINIQHRHTFGIPATAAVWAEYASVEELKRLLEQFRGRQILPIGAGSNLLFTHDFDGVLLHSAMRRVLSLTEDDEAVYVEAGSGIVLDEFIAQLVDMGLYGLENLSYIPGTVGASAVQNVGAYGVEAKDVITRVHAVRIADGEERDFTNEDCRFGYRDSIFKQELSGQYVITSVTYRLSKKPIDYPESRIHEATLALTREKIIQTRREKLPEVSEYGSAGSFFKNPVVDPATADRLKASYPDMPCYPAADGAKLSAAWLIDQCGLKGKQIGGARVWDKQPLVLVNYTGTATAADIRQLATDIEAAVLDRFGVRISPEVIYI